MNDNIKTVGDLVKRLIESTSVNDFIYIKGTLSVGKRNSHTIDVILTNEENK